VTSDKREAFNSSFITRHLSLFLSPLPLPELVAVPDMEGSSGL
jgi:hypothetical protein